MNENNNKNAIESFLSALSSEAAEEDKILKLIKDLDRLALCVNDVHYTFDEKDYNEPPKHDCSSLREIVSKQFPSLGFYKGLSQITKICYLRKYEKESIKQSEAG